MSLNQSRANKNESHYRKTGRPAYSAQQRGSSGRGGKGGGSTGLPPSPSSSSNTQSSSFSTNRSFKKSNGQGAQSWVIAASANSDSNATVSRAAQNAVQNGARAQSPLLDSPVSDVTIKKSSDLSSQKSNRAVPRAPSSQSASGTSDSKASTSTTQGDASGAFSLQFGSFVNEMQIPARTSSAPPNLDEQKHNQAQHESFRSGPMVPISAIPREQQPRRDVQQYNSRESHPPTQPKGDIHIPIPAAPAVTNTQSSSALHLSGVSMAIPLQKQQFPMQPSVPNPQIQAQGMTTTSLQMPMSLPVGGSTKVQQQVFVPGLQAHPLQHQGMVHQGHGLNFPPHMGHPLGSQFGNLGIGINPQFAQQQAPRRTVKITHPETHEELRLDKKNDMNLDGGSLGPRSHPKSLQSPSIPYASTHQISYYSHVQPNTMFFQSPTSLPLTSTEMASQASRINYPIGQGSQTVSFMNPSTLNSLSVSKTGPSMHWIADSSNFEHAPSSRAVVSAALSASRPVTVKPATGSIGEKIGSSLVSASSPVDDKSDMPKLLRPHVEASSIPEPTGSIPLPLTIKRSVVPSAAVLVERLPPSNSNFPHVALTGETESNVNNTEDRREPVRRSNSIMDRLKKPNKKDQCHSQPLQQAETSTSVGSSGDVTIYPDNTQASPSKLVEPSASTLIWPSLDLEHTRSLEGGVSETVECITPPPSGTCEDVSVSDVESLPDVHEGVGDAPVEGIDSAQIEVDSTCGISNKSSVGTVSDHLGEDHDVKQDNCSLRGIQLKEGILGSAERRNAELSEQPKLDSKNIGGNKIKMPADSFSSRFSKVSIYSEQDFNSSETTVHSEIVNGPSSDSNDSEINPYHSVLSADCSDVKSLSLKASKSGSVCSDGQEIPLLESGKTCQESPCIPTPVISASVSKLGEKVAENVNGGLVRILPSGSKGKPTLEVNRVKSTIARGRKKRKEILQKANAAGTSDLYLAYKGPKEKLEPTISSESVDSTSSIDAGQISLDVKEEDAVASKGDGKSEAEQDNWEDAADISCPKLKISDNGGQVHGGLQHREEDVNGVMGKTKYSRDFLLTFSGQCTDLPAGFEIKYDIVEALMGSKASISKHVDRNPYPSSGRIIDRPTVVSRPDQCGSGMVGVGWWNKSTGPIASRHNPRLDISQGGIAAEHVEGAGVVAGNEYAAEPVSETACTFLGMEVREELEPTVRGSVEGFIEFTTPQECEEDGEKVSASEDDSESNVYHEERSKRGHDVRIKSESGSGSGSGSDEDTESGSESESGEDSDTEGEREESESDGEEEEESESESESESEKEEIVASRSSKGKEKVVAKGKWKAKSKGISQPSGSATAEFPGGPKKMDILKGFETHVARYIWDGQDREPLKCIQHITKIYEWHWKTECKRFRKRVNNTHLCQLMQVSYTHINRVLISAFVERWHPETNTFHLPFGEMTITLDDVKQITGLPVVGKGVRAPDIRKEDAIGLLHKFLGVSREVALDELKINKCNYVRMEWLRITFGNKAKKSDSNADIDRHVRAYLLYLLGCTLFSDKTGTKVPVTYLNFLSDVGNVANYAWGAAGLAYLYRQLGVATRVEVKQITGYLTLMEAWIYEHFIVERPTPDLQYVNGNPRAMKWKPRSSVSAVDAPNRLKFLRQQIDNIIKENVIWDPYRGSRDAHPFQDIAWYCGCITFCDVVEPYHPARVLRQFGYVQTSQWNHAPIPPTKAKRGAKANLYFVKHIYVEYIWTTWSHHCLSVSSRGELCKADSPWMCEDGYEEWYSERSHVRIHPTDSTSTFYHPSPRSFRDAYIDLNNRRKKALTLLQESEIQTLHDILKRERLIASILSDDTIADTAQTSAAEVREEEIDTGLLSRETSRRVKDIRGRRRASTDTDGRG